MTDSIQKPSIGQASNINYFTESEISHILTVLHEGENRLLFLVGLELGCRVSEIKGLKWSDLQTKDIPYYVVLWDEKKDRHRVCTLPDYIWKLLRQHRKEVDERGGKHIFPYSESTINRRIKQWAKDAGINRRVRWHCLRHTYVVQSRAKGRDWSIISMQTGDTPATLISIYSQLTLEDRHRISDESPLISYVGDKH
jgi:integrase